MMYITIGKNKKRYYPDEWQFVAYQFLNIHIEDDDMEGEPFCLKGSKKISLTNIDRHGRRLDYWQLPYDDYLKPTVGRVCIAYKKKNGEQVEERIVILPSIIDGEEFKIMAIQIANIAFNRHSFTYADFDQRVNQGGGLSGGFYGANIETRKSDQLHQLLDKLPKFLEILSKNLTMIERNPALSMRATIKKGDIKKSRKAKDLILRKTQSHKKNVFMYDKVYDEYSPENEWLGYLVYSFLPDLLNKFLRKYVDYLEKCQDDERKKSDTFNQLYGVIEEVDKKLKKIQNHALLKKFKSISVQPKPTTRLSKAKGYSSVFRAYNQIFSVDFLKAFQQYQETVIAYTSGTMDNLSNIYEHWCLVILYDSLLNLGFMPKSNSDRLEQKIRLEDGNLVLPSETTFELQKPFSGKNISIKIYYEPKLFFEEEGRKRYLTPDIYIDINAPKKKLGLEKFSLILDAKFKNYEYLNLGYFLSGDYDLKDVKYFQDVMHTSMYKYHYRLANFYMHEGDLYRGRVGMSAILHPNDTFLWQGEKPLVNCDFLALERGNVLELFKKYPKLNSLTYNDFVSHKFGSLVFRPKSLAQDIRRLFTLIFHYHMGLTSLCLCCGRELHEEYEFLVNCDERRNTSDINKSMEKKQKERSRSWSNSDPETKFHAKCKVCNTQWRISFCANETPRHSDKPSHNNRIVKIGISDDVGWIPIHDRFKDITFCPSCGSGLYSQGKKRTTREEQLEELEQLDLKLRVGVFDAFSSPYH